MALDRRHLLAQQHFALALVERSLGLLADLLRQPQDFDAMRQLPRHLVHARRDVDGLENLLLFVRLHVHIGGGEVGELRGRLDRLDRGKQILRHLRQELDRLERLRLEIDEARLDFRRLCIRLGNAQHARDQERPAAQIFDDLEARFALADDMVGAVGRGDVAHDIGDRAHAMHVDLGRIVHVGGALQQDADLALVAHGLLGGRDRFRTPQSDRQHQSRKQDGVAHRNNDERIGRQWRQSAAFARRSFQLQFVSHG